MRGGKAEKMMGALMWKRGSSDRGVESSEKATKNRKQKTMRAWRGTRARRAEEKPKKLVPQKMLGKSEKKEFVVQLSLVTQVALRGASTLNINAAIGLSARGVDTAYEGEQLRALIAGNRLRHASFPRAVFQH